MENGNQGNSARASYQGNRIYFFLALKYKKKGGAFPHYKRHTASLVVAPPCTPALPHKAWSFAIGKTPKRLDAKRQVFRYPPVMVPYSD